jgi:hypothetical protein
MTANERNHIRAIIDRARRAQIAASGVGPADRHLFDPSPEVARKRAKDTAHYWRHRDRILARRRERRERAREVQA